MILAQTIPMPTPPAGNTSVLQVMRLTGFDPSGGAPYFGVIQSLLLVGLGIVFLIFGFKYVRLLVMVNCAAVGGGLGFLLGRATQAANQTGPSMSILLALTGALIFGVLAWPLLRGAVALLGGLWGLAIGLVLWEILANILGNPGLEQYRIAGALVGMTALGMLTFIAFKPVVMIFTSIQGAIMVVLGSASLLRSYNDLRPSVLPALEHSCIPAIFIACLTLVGFVLQYVKGGVKKAAAPSPKPASA